MVQKQEKVINRGDAMIYYEISGEGQPVVILHGGLGSISSYSFLVDSLKVEYKVIAVSTRGHGKSTLGKRPYNFGLFAEDVMAILDKEKIATASIVGFSDGAITAYYLAAYYPQRINKIVALAGAFGLSDYKPEGLEWIKSVTSKQMLEETASLVARKRMDSLIECMRPAWMAEVYVPQSKVVSIQAPVLIIGGDKDFFFRKEHFEYAHQIIPNSQLVILSNTGHNLKTPAVIHKLILPFLRNGQPNKALPKELH